VKNFIFISVYCNSSCGEKEDEDYRLCGGRYFRISSALNFFVLAI
jgi:hypothetical protein